MSESDEQLNAENIESRYSEVGLSDGEPIHTRSKDSAFESMCDCPEKYIKFTMWSCVLNFFSECPGVFFTDTEM